MKVVDYKEQCQTMENRLLEVNQLANQSQLQLNDTTDVIKSLEESWLKGNFTETPNKFLGFPNEWTVAGTNF